MPDLNPDNIRVKRRYFHFLTEAKQLDEATVDKVAFALTRFEEHTRHRPFKSFNHEQAVSFKRRLSVERSKDTGKPLSKATTSAILRHLKAFFEWLSQQQGFRSHLTFSDAAYFNLSAKDERVAHTHREKPFPTLRQLKAAFLAMPSETIIDRRNRAVFALIVLTGGRDGAVASLRLKHLDLIEDLVHFDAREVKTKAAKSFTTYSSQSRASIVRQWRRGPKSFAMTFCSGTTIPFSRRRRSRRSPPTASRPPA